MAGSLMGMLMNADLLMEVTRFELEERRRAAEQERVARTVLAEPKDRRSN